MFKCHKELKNNICEKFDEKEFFAGPNKVVEFREKLLESIKAKYTFIVGNNDSKKVKRLWIKELLF